MQALGLYGAHSHRDPAPAHHRSRTSLKRRSSTFGPSSGLEIAPGSTTSSSLSPAVSRAASQAPRPPASPAATPRAERLGSWWRRASSGISGVLPEALQLSKLQLSKLRGSGPWTARGHSERPPRPQDSPRRGSNASRTTSGGTTRRGSLGRWTARGSSLAPAAARGSDVGAVTEGGTSARASDFAGATDVPATLIYVRDGSTTHREGSEGGKSTARSGEATHRTARDVPSRTASAPMACLAEITPAGAPVAPLAQGHSRAFAAPIEADADISMAASAPSGLQEAATIGAAIGDVRRHSTGASEITDNATLEATPQPLPSRVSGAFRAKLQRRRERRVQQRASRLGASAKAVRTGGARQAWPRFGGQRGGAASGLGNRSAWMRLKSLLRGRRRRGASGLLPPV
jgi:hypothetical protein